VSVSNGLNQFAILFARFFMHGVSATAGHFVSFRDCPGQFSTEAEARGKSTSLAKIFLVGLCFSGRN